LTLTLILRFFPGFGFAGRIIADAVKLAKFGGDCRRKRARDLMSSPPDKQFRLFAPPFRSDTRPLFDNLPASCLGRSACRRRSEAGMETGFYFLKESGLGIVGD
jgi:hypothetical protein